MTDSPFIKTALFQGLNEEEIQKLLTALSIREDIYEKGSIIFHTGQVINTIGLVLAGRVSIENIDLFGQRSILGIAQTGDVFAESYAFAKGQPLLVDVIAREDSRILFLNGTELITLSAKLPEAGRVILNLLGISSRKNLQLSMRIFHSTPKKIRDRIWSYFSEQVTLQASTRIQIPLDRQQLADYLSVDRTALSKELGRMKKEGLIDFHKNEFIIYN